MLFDDINFHKNKFTNKKKVKKIFHQKNYRKFFCNSTSFCCLSSVDIFWHASLKPLMATSGSKRKAKPHDEKFALKNNFDNILTNLKNFVDF